MRFSAAGLLQQLRRYPPAPAYWVAFSGGLDSSVLLHALHACAAEAGVAIGAVHVNHGLQADAPAWEAHCRRVCTDLGVPCEVLRVEAVAARGESPEAAARAARYGALERWLPAGHCLLSAQHRDDQAETLLLQLLRGSGVHGLAAMPQRSRFSAGVLLRPLLEYTRAELQAYALAASLHWVEDPSNRDTAFDRNFLRAAVLPVLAQRWPGAAASLARSAGHCAEAAGLVAQLAELDLQHVQGGRPGTLAVSGLLSLPVARCRNVLRHWIRAHGGSFPATAVLARILEDVLGSRRDAEPRVRCGMHEVRRYRDTLYLLPVRPAAHALADTDWSLREPLSLPQAGGVLRATPGTGCGLCRALLPATGVRVRWRRGGERCRPAGRRHHHSLKKLFQARGIPPWERDLIPLVYIGDELAAVAGLWVCEPFQAGPADAGVRIDWERG